MSTPPPDSPARPQPAPTADPTSGAGSRAWSHTAGHWMRDLAMGARFTVTGGREGWARTLLTAVGVGLGVALLLFTTTVPSALQQHNSRELARDAVPSTAKTNDTLLVAFEDTTFRNERIVGKVLQPEGPKAPLPPGVTAFPKPGDMLVSPALKELLSSDEGALLRKRLPYRITGTIADQGLAGPSELAYYAGSRELHVRSSWSTSVHRVRAFGIPIPFDPFDPVQLLLIMIVFVVLLTPVCVFIAAAVRFGGERRDRRLAALRLIGSDSRMTRRIAAGEAMAGATLGLALGAIFFAVGRQLAGHVTLMGVSVFPSDLTPTLALVVLVACTVPLAAIVVTLLALRNVVIEPLGVVRTARPARRRLWWRVLPPLGGLALLYPMMGHGNDAGNFNEWQVITGVLLLLVGVTALLPWGVEAVVSRLSGGSVSWQLAVRRLQLSSGTASRMVNGIAVAVAGAIALQMLFVGVQGSYTRVRGNNLSRVQMTVSLPSSIPLADADRTLRHARGVRHTTTVGLGTMKGKPKKPGDPADSVSLSVGTCAALRELAHLPTCREGDAFVVAGMHGGTDAPKVARPGRMMFVDPALDSDQGKPVPWRLPATLKTATSRRDPQGGEHGGVLVTPSVLPPAATRATAYKLFVRLDPATPDAADQVRTAAATIEPLAQVFEFTTVQESEKFATIRTGLFVGALCVLMLIGASLLVSQLEQLRERKKLLSTLVAFGTKRRTLSLSVLWQTAIPVALGLLLASGIGVALGTVLLRLAESRVFVDWASVGFMTGLGAVVVLAVTALSMPPLVRMMRPEGLRTE